MLKMDEVAWSTYRGFGDAPLGSSHWSGAGSLLDANSSALLVAGGSQSVFALVKGAGRIAEEKHACGG